MDMNVGLVLKGSVQIKKKSFFLRKKVHEIWTSAKDFGYP